MNKRIERRFEYSEEEITIENRNVLEAFLQHIYQEKQNYFDVYNQESEVDENKKPSQPFLSFDGNRAWANNYIGFIQHENLHLEIYPKVFKHHHSGTDYSDIMLKHLFFWFDYCRRWKFPFNKNSLDVIENATLPELIINLMASQIFNTISSLPISLYQPIEESLTTPKGKINFSRYAANSLSKGKNHLLECDYEPFIFDNKLNQIIKFSARILLNRTNLWENQKVLNDIIFVLDEVTDIPCTVHDIEGVTLNPLYTDYNDIIDIVRLIIQQQLYNNQQHEQSHWCLLLPMEQIFEDFLAGFLKQHFSSEWNVEYQKSDVYLSSIPEAFQMKHDILLTSKSDKNKCIIIDAKYKQRGLNFKNDKKKGVSQTDMYQMTSYALRRNCKHVIILYPNLKEELQSSDSFIVKSGFPGADEIKVIAAEIPFWTTDSFTDLSEKLNNHLAEILLFF